MINSRHVLISRYLASRALLFSLLPALMLAQVSYAQADNTEDELATAAVSLDLLSREFRID